MKKKILFCLFAILASVSSALFVAAPSFAEPLCPDGRISKSNPLDLTRWCDHLTTDDMDWTDSSTGSTKMRNTIIKIIDNIGTLITEVGAYIAVALVMYGGFVYMTSTGDPGKNASGKRIIANAVIGLIITKVAGLILGTINGVASLSHEGTIGSVAKAFASEFLFWGGAICVIMIIWGGLQYTTSAGDPGKATKAKQTILSAVIGLLIMIFAGMIVSFAISKL